MSPEHNKDCGGTYELAEQLRHGEQETEYAVVDIATGLRRRPTG